jgi:enamine deaminase RidA (YjgF/YER057c/UK114 family)
MTQTSTPTPAAANFLNPGGVHRPTGYTHVVEVTAGRPVYIAGQIALDPAGELVGPGDIRAQARQVFENLQTALRSVGAGFEQVVKLNLYLLDATQLPAVREVRDRYVDTARHRRARPWRSAAWPWTACSWRSRRWPSSRSAGGYPPGSMRSVPR